MLKNEEFEEASRCAQEQLRTGTSFEMLLLDLRAKGADKIDSIKIAKSAMNISMAQAKSLVDRSEAWSDRYSDDRAFHEAVKEAAHKLKGDNSCEVIIEERSIEPEL